MELVRNIYLRLYLIVMAFYVFFDKGVAYSFAAEFLWITGILLLFLFRKKIAFPNTKALKLLLLFLGISLIYIIKGVFKYPLIDVIRDSLIFQYGWFVFIIILYEDEQDFIWKKIISIYTWYPFIAFGIFIAQFFIPSLSDFKPFGDIPLILYKYGDMGVHLLISTIILLLFIERIPKKLQWALILFIVLDFLILSAYSRSGMFAFLVSTFCFIYFNKDVVLKTSTRVILKYIPWILLIALPIYVNLQVSENFQGRSIGIEQVLDNFGSIAGTSVNANSEKNITWRLIWWAKIIDYSFTPSGFIMGKGLGMSLADTDDISSLDNELRSPHNFQLNIMARFGVLIFLAWLYWLCILFKPIFKKQASKHQLAIICILIAFFINSNFDVFLEGPMGAFPFWTWVGLYFITEAHS